MQPVPNAGKHYTGVTGAQAREKGKPIGKGGKNTTNAKRGKT